MGLENLAAEYENAADIVSLRIRERREKMKTLPPYSRESGILRTELGILYRERRDTLDTARHLRNYYGKGKA